LRGAGLPKKDVHHEWVKARPLDLREVEMSKAKLSGSHSTLTPTSDVIRRFVARLPEVTKVGAGLIKPSGPGPIRVKITKASGAIHVKVRGATAVQDVWIYSKDHPATIDALKAFVGENDWQLKVATDVENP
jgi:hypothetical protein